MGRLITAFKAVLAAQMLPRFDLPAAAGQAGDAPAHFRPLDGRNLRQIAARKRHHGKGIFINPMGVPRSRRFWQVLSWKLFHTNAYGDFLGDQPVAPVTVDWEPVNAHRGVSVTFIKHSTLLIKDVNRVLLIDPVFTGVAGKAADIKHP